MTSRARRSARAAVVGGSLGAAALAAHAALNAQLLRTPPTEPAATSRSVAVLVPCRDEEGRIARCLSAVLSQRGIGELRVYVLDDASRDGTADTVLALAEADPRLVPLLSREDPPPGWLGKTWACQRLTRAALNDGTARRPPEILVLVDADVELAPDAVASTVALMDSTGLDVVSPYPRQTAVTPAERLVQPLLQWSWLTFLPLRAAERSGRPSLAAANGQFLAIRSTAYLRAGAHAGIRDQVLDDVALLRAVKRSGGRGVVVDGTSVATCRMYADWPALRDGYAKSLWAAYGSPAGAAAVSALLIWLYVVPPAAGFAGSGAGMAGYAAAVAGRVVAARRTGGRAFPDALAHPVGVALVTGLTARSVRGRRRGTLAWRGRPLPAPGGRG